MPHHEIKKTLEELKGELQQTPKETSRFEEALEAAKDGVEHYTPEAVKDLIQLLELEASEFKREHPRITALINNVMTSLSNIGI